MKTALILSGGGCDCAFGGGFAVALGRELGLAPDVVIAGSGSAGTAAYFCARQFDETERIWTNHVASKLLINKLRFNRIMNIDYLIDVIFKKLEPLDVEKLKKSKTKCIIAATKKKDGLVTFFDDWNKFDIFEVLRATKSIPYICNRGVKVGNEIYEDSIHSSGVRFLENDIDLHVYDCLIIIENGKNTWVQKLLGAKKPYFPKHHNILYIKNDTKLNFSIINNSEKFLKKQFTKGYNACMENKEKIKGLNLNII
ncbi:MAG: patatin-like phospholipase family protein [Patescibacteria group bacterium]